MTLAQARPVIEARDLWRIYRSGPLEVPALRGVNLAVHAGEMVAIMGPSGCGKTTLLNCLAGLDDPDRGEVFIEGINLRTLSDDKRTIHRARRMGFVFQSHNLLPVLSAVENVELPMLVAGVSSKEARRRSCEALAAVNLSDRLDHRPAQLSGGQQQRVAIARAIATDPAIVWADEPTGNLDSESATAILDLFQRLNRQRGQTLVIVTHAKEVGDRCDRIIRMSDGQIVA
ncbi:MAG: ABC transporter ATP-binding protein [Dehalococcoidia bacterium]|nr:MAG: ABC transporter ATP-binding protein [Dehalococcoidia bacterium]